MHTYDREFVRALQGSPMDPECEICKAICIVYKRQIHAQVNISKIVVIFISKILSGIMSHVAKSRLVHWADPE